MNVQATAIGADDRDVISIPQVVRTPEAPDDVMEHAAPHAIRARHVAPEDWRRFETYMSEIFIALGM
ncbi:MAG: hypothetical protein ACM3QU_08130, partial [Verrucomicrobiota bacterium]